MHTGNDSRRRHAGLYIGYNGGSTFLHPFPLYCLLRCAHILWQKEPQLRSEETEIYQFNLAIHASRLRGTMGEGRPLYKRLFCLFWLLCHGHIIFLLRSFSGVVLNYRDVGS